MKPFFPRDFELLDALENASREKTFFSLYICKENARTHFELFDNLLDASENRKEGNKILISHHHISEEGTHFLLISWMFLEMKDGK